MKRLFTTIVLAMVLICFSVVGSEAGVKKIRPDQLKAHFSNREYIQSPEFVCGHETTDQVWNAYVKLPIGSRITKLKYYHQGNPAAYPVSTGVNLFRAKFGGRQELMASIPCADDTDTPISVEDTTIVTPMVKSGYTYFVEVFSTGHNSKILGIKIYYQD